MSAFVWTAVDLCFHALFSGTSGDYQVEVCASDSGQRVELRAENPGYNTSTGGAHPTKPRGRDVLIP